jgi:hypothetical protein
MAGDLRLPVATDLAAWLIISGRFYSHIRKDKEG